MKLFLSVLILSFSLLSLVPHVWAQDPHAAIAASLTRIEAALKAGPTTAAVSSDPVDDVIRLEYSMMKLDRLQAMRARLSGGTYGGRSTLSQATGCGPLMGAAGGAVLHHAGVFGGGIGLAAALVLGAVLCL